MGWKGAGLSLQSRPLQLSASDKSPLRGAWVCLHVRSAAAAYGDLGKTRVTPSRALTKAIAAAVEQALAQARQHWAELGLLLSAEEQRRQAFERSAPHIAKAIGAVLSSSRSAESELQAGQACPTSTHLTDLRLTPRNLTIAPANVRPSPSPRPRPALQADCLQLLGAARPEECEAQLQALLLRCWARASYRPHSSVPTQPPPTDPKLHTTHTTRAGAPHGLARAWGAPAAEGAAARISR